MSAIPVWGLRAIRVYRVTPARALQAIPELLARAEILVLRAILEQGPPAIPGRLEIPEARAIREVLATPEQEPQATLVLPAQQVTLAARAILEPGLRATREVLAIRAPVAR